MAASDHLLQVFDRHPGIKASGLQVLMSQKLLDVPDIGGAFQEMGGAGVTKAMRVCWARDPGLPSVTSHDIAVLSGAEPPAPD